jgi:hypothetical protein
MISSSRDDAPTTARGEHGVMVNTARRKLHNVRADLRAGGFFVRRLTPHLVGTFLESRKRRIAVYTVGGAAAGLAAVKLALHRPPTDSA